MPGSSSHLMNLLTSKLGYRSSIGRVLCATTRYAPQLHPVVVPQSSHTMQCPDTFMRIELHVSHWSPV